MSSRTWTEQELDFLREHYPRLGSARVARILHRHPNNVGVRAHAMGLDTSREAGYRSPLFSGVGEITGEFMSRVRKGAHRRGYAFELTAQFVYDLWVRQEKRCYYSGREIGFTDKTASIDRLDSAKPYTPDNVVLVHKLVNKMKLGRTHDEFIRLAHQIVGYQNDHA